MQRICLAIYAAGRIRTKEALKGYADLMLEHGVPEHIRSGNGPETVAEELRDWLQYRGTNTACIEPCSPGESGYREPFNGRSRDELLNVEIFCTLKEVRVVLHQRSNHCGTRRPHSAPGKIPPAPEVVMPKETNGAMATG